MDRSPETRAVEADAVDVAVVRAGEGTDSYCMFQAENLSPEGAVLTGGLLLEVNEEVTLEIELGDGGPAHARARVVAIVPDDRPAMRVKFVDLDDATRQRFGRRRS